MNSRREDHTTCVLLFTKPVVPGRVKTRLIGELSAEQAARLHAAFLGDLSERLAGGRFHLQVAWALSGNEPFPTGLVAGGEHLRQAEGDLGERLYRGLFAAASRRRADGSKRFTAVAAVGSDHPELELKTVEQAFAHLAAGADAVFGPARDGGYYLVALGSHAVRRELFEGVPWSTGEVLDSSLTRCRRLGLEVALLPVGHDVDVAGDLKRLAARLVAGTVDCPRTRALLTRWGRLRPSIKGE